MSSELSEMEAELDRRRDFIPPLFGARHVELRKRFIIDQISQQKDPFGLIVGDSIIEGFNFPDTGGIPVINAGMGGG